MGKVSAHAWREMCESSLCAFVLTYLAAAATQAGHVPLMMVLAITATAGLAGALITFIVFESWPVTVLIAAWGVLDVWWIGYARAHGVWTMRSFVGLTIPALLLMPLGVRAWAKLEERARRAEDAEDGLAKGRDAARFRAILEKLGFSDDDVLVLNVVKAASGRIVHLKIRPLSRVTIDDLQAVEHSIDVALSKPRGTARFDEGDHAGLVDLVISDAPHVEPVPFPDENPYPTTVNDEFDIGLDENGNPAWVLFREVAVLVVGERGAGKTNLANVMLAQLLRCVDVMVFGVDVAKGGRLLRPWMMPWVEGRGTRPAIDWIATTRDEAELMLRAVKNAIRGRSMIGVGPKHVPSPQEPALVLLVDELASIAGTEGGPRAIDGEGATNRVLAQLIADITFTGRSEAIDPVLFALRGTVSMVGGGDLKSQMGMRIALGVASTAEAGYVVEDDRIGARLLAGLKRAGSGLIVFGKARPKLIRFYQLEDPARIDEIAEAVSQYRPPPDLELENALGEAYAARWDRPHWHELMTRWTAQNGNGGAMAALRNGGAVATLSLDEQFRAALHDVKDPESGLHPARARIRAHLMRQGVAGDTPFMLGRMLKSAGLEVHRGTIHKWLADDEKAGLVQRVGDGRWRWVRNDPQSWESAS